MAKAPASPKRRPGRPRKVDPKRSAAAVKANSTRRRRQAPRPESLPAPAPDPDPDPELAGGGPESCLPPDGADAAARTAEATPAPVPELTGADLRVAVELPFRLWGKPLTGYESDSLCQAVADVGNKYLPAVMAAMPQELVLVIVAGAVIGRRVGTTKRTGEEQPDTVDRGPQGNGQDHAGQMGGGTPGADGGP